jgi:hypothetical protein
MGNYCIIPDTQNNIIELTNKDCEVTLQSSISFPSPPEHHNFTHFTGGVDPLSPQDIGAQNAWETPIFSSFVFRAVKGKHYIIKNQIAITPLTYSITDPLGASIGDFYVVYHEGGPNINIGGVIYNTGGTLLTRIYQAVGLSGQWKTQILGQSQSLAKAWINYNGVTRTIKSSFNVNSVTYQATGQYIINFTRPFSDTNYVVVIFARDYNSDSFIANLGGLRANSTKTTSSLYVTSNYVISGVYVDSPEYSVVIY